MNYSDDSFDPAVLTFPLQGKKWVTFQQHHRMFQMLLGYIASNLVDENGGYTADILPAKSADQNPLQLTNYDRVVLRVGFGQYSFKALNGEVLYALYQHVGKPVGTGCGVQLMENLVIFTSSTLEQLAKFLSEIIRLSEKPEEGKFLCFTWMIQHLYWREDVRVNNRPIESVVLPSATKNRVVKDIEKFLSAKTKDFYHRNGIPYRRSYLFYGIPGTGKTSLVQALAGHFQRNVCYLLPTHPDMTDDNLREAIHQIPDNSIVVFEDIDSLFTKDRENKSTKSALTYSGLLNALDGIGSPNGQIFVLTTNLRDNLDHALIRNGRVDLHVEFTYATEEQMEIMWTNFYPQGSQLANDFSSRVMTSLKEKGLAVTTSALQHFFITQMDATPEEALEQSHTIVDEIVQNSSQSMLESARNAASASASESASKENENLKGEDEQVAEETKEQEQAKKLSKSARRRLNRKVHRSVLNT